jgi:hypothetical protein
MLAPAKNYDIICLQMRTYMPHLESSMKRELGKLLAEIKDGLTTNKKIKPLLDSLLPRVFNFRIKAIKWLVEEGELDFSTMMDEIYPQLEELRQNPKLEILAENILFALRCNKKVVKALMGSEDFSEEKFSTSVLELPTITYNQFLATLAYSIPDDETAQKIVDWINASLYIEFIILSAVITNDKKLKVSEKIINELSFLIADAAQEYSAIAMELGFLESHFKNKDSFSEKADKSFIKEQKYLADFGINDFAENF